MNVLYASSDLYAPITGISIYSLFENNKNINHIRVFLIDNGISDINQNKLSEVARRYKRELVFIKPGKLDLESQELKAILPRHKQWLTHWAVSYLDLLPRDVERILFVDSDTIITGSLEGIMDVDLSSTLLAAVCSPYKNKLMHYCEYSVDYFVPNLGILYINVPAFTRQQVYAEFCKLLAKLYTSPYRDEAAIADGVFGLALKDRAVNLPIRYNYCIGYADVPYKYNAYADFILHDMGLPEQYWDEIKKSYKNPLIIHYAGSGFYGRPWEKSCVGPLRWYFDRYKNISPWKDMVLFPSSRKKAAKIVYILKCLLPYPVFFLIRYKFMPGPWQRIKNVGKRRA